MKIMHLADLHLDSPFVGIGKQLQRLQHKLVQAPFQAFERSVAIAINQQVELVIIAGDIYDADQQTIHAQYFFVQQLERLQQAGIPVILTHGNHDYLKLERQALNYPDNVHVLKQADVTSVDIPLANGESVRVYGFSYTKRWISERMIDQYPVNPHETTYTIGVLHGQIEGSDQKQHYAPFDLPSLLSKNYDYWALGHIHQAQQLHEQPIVQYSGTIQGRHRNELGDKGGYIVELQPNAPAKQQFISLASIVWQTATIDCRAEWHEVALLREIEQVIKNYREEAGASQQSQLLTIVLTHFEVLDTAVQQQIEQGDLLDVLNQGVQDVTPFVAVAAIQIERQLHAEPFQYDASLKESFEQSTVALETGELYTEVMQPVFQHQVIKGWLNALTQDATLKSDLTEAAQQLVVQAVGFEAEEVSHED